MTGSHTEDWIERFTAWAEARDDIRAAVVIGSRGRQDYYPADETYSDLDVLFLTTKLGLYAASPDWIHEISPAWVALIDGKEWFWNMSPVLCGFSVCDGPLIVDFVVLSTRRIRWMTRVIRWLNRLPRLRRWLPDEVADTGKAVADGLRHGARVLFDKDGLMEQFRRACLAIPPESPSPPTLKEFQRCIDNFWYGVVLVVNNLQRGRLFAVKREIDGLGKRILLQMAEWHTRSGNNWQDDSTWYRDKLIEQWADPRIVAALPQMFVAYDIDALWQSLFALMECFRWLTEETAQRLGYDYSPKGDDQITPWVMSSSKNRNKT